MRKGQVSLSYRTGEPEVSCNPTVTGYDRPGRMNCEMWGKARDSKRFTRLFRELERGTSQPVRFSQPHFCAITVTVTTDSTKLSLPCTCLLAGVENLPRLVEALPAGYSVQQRWFFLLRCRKHQVRNGAAAAAKALDKRPGLSPCLGKVLGTWMQEHIRCGMMSCA